ncbi:Rab-GTPase-TBC domain containing protein [Nitzschia inconspicua]|uniref:Rab-GTPase-TBC domain containing protein n=1 Tax=Nitzschia inconspicua TaxID=303405 RepID=A0A9K3K905_9STRA|nr:Rab-GTPase-TBC domain containing protein [Nitzschia inconspicua]KAG7362175.1 Rab-GTPase-TBC domain containing protein [Nitzschia inconspicua]
MTESMPISPPPIQRPATKRKGGGNMGEELAWDASFKSTMGTRQNSNTPGAMPSLSATSDPMMRKAEEINLILLQPEVDLWRLRELALSEGGLVNDTLRKRAWPRLVGLDFNLEPFVPLAKVPSSNPDAESFVSNTVTSRASAVPRFEIDTTELKNKEKIETNSLLVESMDAQQIERDVARCTWHLLTGSQRSRRLQYQNKQRSKKVAALLKKKQRRLANLINLTLVASYDHRPVSERLRYYQGFHDVACIFMHALGGTASATAQAPSTPSSVDTVDYVGGDFELPSKVLQQVSFSHLSDALQSNFLQLQTGIKLVLFPLLAKLDSQVHNHLLDADMEPFFCLSWIITWFSHDVRDTQLVKRLFDAFIVSHPLLPTYMAISMMLHPYNRQRILDTDCDFASLHQVLASLPRNSCRVGWKRRNHYDDGGLEYISDHEDECCGGQHEPYQSLAAPRQPGGGGSSRCDVTASTEELEFYSSSNAGTGSIVSGGDDTSSGQWIALDRDGSEKSFSKPGSKRGYETNPVPFQEVLDTALQYMKRYPPSCLVTLARTYYRDDWINQLALLNLQSSGQQDCTLIVQQQIGLLRPCQSFSIAPFCASDWVEKQRLRQILGLKSSSRKDRRRKKKAINGSQSPNRHLPSTNGSDDVSVSSNNVVSSEVDPMKFIRLNPNHLAVIAVGYGPGLLPELIAAAKKRHRRRILVGSVVLGFAAMGGSFYFQASEQTLFGASTTRDFFGSFLSSSTSPASSHSDFINSGSDSCHGPNLSDRNETNSKSAAMNKAASVILPRINVLQELPSSSVRTVVRNPQLPKPPKQQILESQAASNIGQKHTKIAISIDSAPLPESKRGENGLAFSFSDQKEKLIRFTRSALRILSRLVFKMVLNPFSFIWRVLRDEGSAYSRY